MTNEKNAPTINIVKKLFYPISGALAYLSLAVPAFAATSVNPCVGDLSKGTIMGAICSIATDQIGTTIRNIVAFFVILAVIISLLYLIYGGIKWITSGGKKEEVEAARGHVVAAVVGLIVVFLAVFIVGLVLSVFGVDLTDLSVPTIIP